MKKTLIIMIIVIVTVMSGRVEAYDAFGSRTISRISYSMDSVGQGVCFLLVPGVNTSVGAWVCLNGNDAKYKELTAFVIGIYLSQKVCDFLTVQTGGVLNNELRVMTCNK